MLLLHCKVTVFLGTKLSRNHVGLAGKDKDKPQFFLFLLIFGNIIFIAMGIIGSALGAVGSIFGAYQASQAAKKAKEGIEQQRAKNEAWYNRRYNEDATQRADFQNLLTKTQELLKNRAKNAAAAQAVTGGSSEALAAEKAGANDAVATMMNNAALNAEKRKERIEAAYMDNDDKYQEQLNQTEKERAAAIAQAAKEAANVASQIEF